MSFTVTTFTIDFEFASSFTFADFFAFFTAFGSVFMVRISQSPNITSVYPSSRSESRPPRHAVLNCRFARQPSKMAFNREEIGCSRALPAAAVQPAEGPN